MCLIKYMEDSDDYPALKPVEVATLKALYAAANGSLSAHLPIQAIQRKFKKDKRHLAKKAVKVLCRLGYVNHHPTGGGMTYELTSMGKKFIERSWPSGRFKMKRF
jgi:Mn-dependent DtxR family transcriptional regulator